MWTGVRPFVLLAFSVHVKLASARESLYELTVSFPTDSAVFPPGIDIHQRRRSFRLHAALGPEACRVSASHVIF
jgi:c-di-GMP-binding flagellar brake protein YcgR